MGDAYDKLGAKIPDAGGIINVEWLNQKVTEGKDFVLTTNPNGSIGESYREEIKTLKDNGYVIPTNPASDGLYHVTKGRK